MEIPGNCRQWARKMQEGADERRILANVKQEPCVDGRVTHEFFKELSRQPEPTNPDDANGNADRIIRTDPDQFLCQGRRVPDNLFPTLFRMERIRNLRYRIPARILDEKGLRDRELWLDSDEDDLRSVTDEYDGEVTLGNPELVWTTDFTQAEQHLDSLDVLYDRLGLQAEDEVGWRVVLCSYSRREIPGPLHVPCVLDALTQPNFQVVVDCQADTGLTRPLSSGLEGLPEAVHRGCSVKPSMWQLGRL